MTTLIGLVPTQGTAFSSHAMPPLAASRRLRQAQVGARSCAISIAAGICLLAASATASAAATEGCTGAVLNVFDAALHKSGAELTQFGGAPYPGGQGMSQAQDIDALLAVANGAGSPMDRFDAFVQSTANNGIRVSSSDYGIIVMDGKLSIGNAYFTIDEIREVMQQTSVADAAAGKGSGGMLSSTESTLGQQDFFKVPAVAAARITAGDFAQRITSAQQLHDLWFNDYARALQREPHFVSQADAKDALDEAWPQLEKTWRLRRAAVFMERFGKALGAEMQRVQPVGAGKPCGERGPGNISDGPQPPAIPFVPWAGTYVNTDGSSTLTVNDRGGSVGGSEKWSRGGRNGTTTWNNCEFTSGNSIKCEWTGTYNGDPEKTGTRHGTLTAAVNGKKITGSYHEQAPSFTGPDGKPFTGYTAMVDGAVWPMDFDRQ